MCHISGLVEVKRRVFHLYHLLSQRLDHYSSHLLSNEINQSRDLNESWITELYNEE